MSCSHTNSPTTQYRSKRSQNGFTLVELLLTIVILSITVAIAVPLFTKTIRDNEIIALRDKLLSSFQFARTESVTRNANVSLCPSTDGATCTNGSDWTDGWIVYIDANAGNTSAVGTLLKVVQENNTLNVAHAGLNAGLNPAVFVRYVPQGFAAYLAPILAQNICFSEADNAATTQGIAISAGSGQVRPVRGC